VIEQGVGELIPTIGTAAACRALDRPRATHYRHHRQSPAPARTERERRPQPRALSIDERQTVLEVVHKDRFVDLSPPQIYSNLIDEGIYLASISTIYRILAAVGEVRERRRQAIHPAPIKPELVAHAPNQVWSWDITKLLGPAKWTFYYLYVILDIFSRYVVGWMISSRESAELARRLLDDSIRKQGISRDQLSVHADRGSSMTSKPVALLLADLGITRSHSRPHVSNDNPYSESQFKTLKYRPDFPSRFGSQQHARAFCQQFFPWYNEEHRHSGLGLLSPADVHHGRAELIRAARRQVLDAAYACHPERFVRRPPTPPALPSVAWINMPPALKEGVG
jgi:putative transposase